LYNISAKGVFVMTDSFAERLARALDARDVKQVELAEKTGISKSAISQYLSGAFVPKQRNTYKIAAALGVNPAWLMGKDVEMEDVSATNIVRYTTTKQVPLLGEIAAGEPILACEDCKTYIEVDGSLQVDFCLRVNGDSMIDARICDRDLVFVRRQPVVENGEIAVVLLDNEATLKRFYRNDGGVILKPENAKYQPRFYTERDFKQVRVLGKAVMFQSLL
jgi:repressor LexA